MPLTLPPNSHPLDTAFLGSTAPVDVLYEAEGPILYTVETSTGQSLLAYVADETTRWLLLAPCNPSIVSDLREGRCAVRDALLGSWLWLAKRGLNGRWDGVWSVNPSAIPEDHLPRAGTLLYPELEPVLSARVIGASIGRATTPASVIAYAADSIRKAIKTLLEHLLDVENLGRPSDALRELYDLPAQRLAFNSFEIAFSAPRQLAVDQSLVNAIELLQRGLKWAGNDDATPIAGMSDTERNALLRAILELTPPSAGPIENVDVGGRWLPRGPTRLTRASRRRVRDELKRLHVEKVVTVEGRVGEFDRDHYSFILRDVEGRKDISCAFSEELFDDVMDAFNSGERVRIVGVERLKKLYVSAIPS
jgi:hypothetical protein